MALGEDDVYAASINTTPGMMSVTPALGTTSPIPLKDSLTSQLGVSNRHLVNALGADFYVHINSTTVYIRDHLNNVITNLTRWSGAYYLTSISENKEVFAIMSWYSITSNSGTDPYVRVSVFNTNTLTWKYFSYQGAYSYNTADHRYFHVSLNSDGSKITFSYRHNHTYEHVFKMLLTSDMLTNVLPSKISASSCKDMVLWMNNDDDLLVCPVGGGTAAHYNFTSDTYVNTATIGNVRKTTTYTGNMYEYSPDSSEIAFITSTDPYFRLIDTTTHVTTSPKSRGDSGNSNSFNVTGITYFKDMLITSVAGYPGIVAYKKDTAGQWYPYSVVQVPACNGVIVPNNNYDSTYLYKVDGTLSEALIADEWVAAAFQVRTGFFAGMDVFTGTDFTIQLNNAEPVYITISANQGDMWIANTGYPLGAKIFPTDPITDPYYYEATTSGTSGISEPLVWTDTVGSTVIDGSVIWTYVERLIQPVTHGPIIPVAT